MTASHRDDSREYQRRKRHAEQGIEVPPPADVRRRRLSLNDSERFKKNYFSSIFSQPFTESRRAQTRAIIGAVRHGGDQAIAAPRGEGKTSNALIDTLWLMFRREIAYPMALVKNAKAAEEMLDALKHELETNDDLAADFPEVCVPVVELGGWASRAKRQHVGGDSTQILWRQDLIALPTVSPETLFKQGWPKKIADETCAAGQMFGAVGIEGRIRGRNVRGRRPDLAILDDLDDEDTADSERETQRRVNAIEKGVAGLAGSGSTIARVMLCTQINRRCVAYIYTDPTQKPTWKGRRYPAVPELPERSDLWEQFVDRYQRGMEELDADGEPRDPVGRGAADYYLANRAAMDAGAVVDNPHAFDPRPAEDGKPLQHSALHAFYIKVARNGWGSVLSEQQQDPPKEGEPESSGISERLVKGRLTGVPRRTAPDGPGVLTIMVDVGKWRLHWQADWTTAGAVASVVDYGEVLTPKPDVKGAEVAIAAALNELADQFDADPFTRPDGEIVPVAAAGVDAGNWNSTVYDFVLSRGGPWRATMGVPNMRSPLKRTRDKRPGRDGWYESRQKHGRRTVWVVNFDPDRWKRRVHEAFLAAPFDADGSRTRGSTALFGDDRLTHTGYAQQICAEVEEVEFRDGKRGEKRYWKKIRRDNHHLDTAVGAAALANVAGVRLLGDGPKKKSRGGAKLTELAKKKRERR